MTKKILLKYFTGTGNSLRVLSVCNNYFQQKGFETFMSSITDDAKDDWAGADLIGFCFPVYAFSLPRICRRFLKSLPKTDDKKKVFLLVTAGAFDESGFSLKIGKKILTQKGYDLIYTDVIEMPSNWTTFDSPPSKEQAKPILFKGEEKALKIADHIANNQRYHHPFNTPKRMGHTRMLFEYFSFYYLGRRQMSLIFRVDSACNSCGICEKVCPTKSITIKKEKPCWNSSCEQCMRCVNFCPKQAIFQAYGGDTKSKNQYYEPHFKPLSKN